MSTYAHTPIAAGGPLRWLERAAHWLDERGKPAWIAVTVIGFIFFWPVGLAILAYIIWSKRMFGTCTKRRTSAPSMTRSSGNSAFDAYRDETLRRLQDEQANFESFLDRLRQAKDKAEFDQFMDDRAKAAKDERTQDDRA
ncbi:DUF2852 domain-containing protein [Roseovarius sp. M141]|uniref:DUF2852 domain-containing protein n=1 Tax=Roseovarius sp. M141 TaxID=2583806 RepID=UPI0020CCEB29|nr:DUF2852 domain-containing protein [Roseovarius sp. M141]MCQ0092790.1 DUF2852 domain-containing protein [Roseovarius sp. M141]